MKRCTQTFYEKVSSRYIYFFSHKVCLQKSFPVWYLHCVHHLPASFFDIFYDRGLLDKMVPQESVVKLVPQAPLDPKDLLDNVDLLDQL